MTGTGDDARNGPDRPLLHPDAAREAQPRPASSSSTRARAERAEAFAERARRPATRRRISRRRSRIRTPTRSSSGSRTTCTRRRSSSARDTARRPVHEAARTQRRGGEADPRHRRARRRLRRLPRGPRLHAEDAQGRRGGARRPDRRRHVGALTRDAPRPAQRVVLGRQAGGRRRDRRPRLPLHRDRPQLRGQGEPARRGRCAGWTRSSTRSRRRTTRSR